MTKNSKPLSIKWLLRIGLAFVFSYAAISSLLHPLLWTGYLPSFVLRLVDPALAIRLLAVYELLLATWLVIDRYIRYAAWLSALTLTGIVIVNPGQIIITFRDIGLVFMALALALVD